jgi:hypothetical protein
MPTPKKTTRTAELPGFAESGLQPLTEPVSVTVHRIVAKRPQRVSLPTVPGESAGGLGYTHDDCRDIDHALYFIAGEGLYRITATGANGDEFSWECLVREPTGPQGSYGRITELVQTGEGYRSNRTQPATTTGYTPSQAPTPPAAPQLQRTMSAEERAWKLEAQLGQQAQDAKHRADMNALTMELRRLQEKHDAKPGLAESAELSMLKEQIAEQKRREEQRADRERIERLVAEQAANTQKQIDAMMQLMQQSQQQQQQQTAQSESANTMMLMVQMMQQSSKDSLEMMRAQAENQKEVARIQMEAHKAQQANALSPRDIIELLNSKNQNTEQLAQGYARLFDMNQHMVETTLQMQPQPDSPAIALLQQGIQHAGQMGQQALELKERQAELQAQQVQAQAAIIAHQAGQQGAAAQLAGAAVQPPAGAVTESEAIAEELEATEEEFFGPAWEDVKKLRMGVRTGTITPEIATQALIKGINAISEAGAVVPAFAMWPDRKFAELVEALVPEADPGFKDRFLSEIVMFVNNVDQGGSPDTPAPNSTGAN